MPVYSITGYASCQSPANQANTAIGTPSVALGLEIRSVNSRFLDLSFRVSDELRSTEPALRELITKQLKRGKVEVRAWLERNGEAAQAVPDAHLLLRLRSAQEAIQATLPSATPLSVAQVLQMAVGNQPTDTTLAPRVQALLSEAITAMLAARAQEGARLATTITDRTAQLRALAEQAEPLVPQLVEQQRQRFLERWQAAMGDVGANGAATTQQAAQDRALTEATAFAIRIDVAEEITRLHSHLDEIDRLLAKGGELGKRLDFLIQELHREANTLGSKSSSIELTRISVDMKVRIEQMREQVQNLE